VGRIEGWPNGWRPVGLGVDLLGCTLPAGGRGVEPPTPAPDFFAMTRAYSGSRYQQGSRLLWRAKVHRIGGPDVGYVDEIFSKAAALGGEVAAALQPAHDLRERADEMSRQVASLRAGEEAQHARLVEAIASGASKPSEASKAAGTWAFDSPASLVLVHASRACHVAADGAARSAGPELFAALQSRVQHVVAESVKRSVALPRGIDSEAKALRHRNGTRSALDTWEALRGLVDTWTEAHELARVMQRAGWVPGPEHPRDRDGARLFERYERPLSLPPGYWNRTAAELRLGIAAASGAGPGLYPWADAVARFERIDRRQRNYVAGQVVRRLDGLGNVVAEEHSPETATEFVSSRR
jgi:hypothetical protein